MEKQHSPFLFLSLFFYSRSPSVENGMRWERQLTKVSVKMEKKKKFSSALLLLPWKKWEKKNKKREDALSLVLLLQFCCFFLFFSPPSPFLNFLFVIFWWRFVACFHVREHIFFEKRSSQSELEKRCRFQAFLGNDFLFDFSCAQKKFSLQFCALGLLFVVPIKH